MVSITKTKPIHAVRKHAAALGAEFAKCAMCPGTNGKVADGKMGCSRAGRDVVWLTQLEAQACDGNKPVFTENLWPAKTMTSRIGQLSAA